MRNQIVFEACAPSVDAAIAAQRGGADRVELCADLLEGGITPSAGSIQLARQHLDIGLQVIIRPRGGDFCYTAVEFEIMRADIQMVKDLGADGVVIGVLNPDGTVDRERTEALIKLARPLNVTFHRAFDMTVNPYDALETLIELGIDRVLTSGQEITAYEGLDLITELVQMAGDRIIIMPGGGIHERSIHKIISRSGVKEIHVAALMNLDSPMAYRNPRAFMGGELRPSEYAIETSDTNKVRAMVHTLAKGHHAD
jgi:copper homeostasis protein